MIGLQPSAIGGSSALSRIGLDGGIYSGGIVGSLQFLGGYKWTMCFSLYNIDLSHYLIFNELQLYL